MNFFSWNYEYVWFYDKEKGEFHRRNYYSSILIEFKYCMRLAESNICNIIFARDRI